MSDINEILKNLVERIEALEEEKKDVQHDIKDLYAEAKSKGIDKKALKKVIKMRKMDKADREEQEETVKYYLDIIE